MSKEFSYETLYNRKIKYIEECYHSKDAPLPERSYPLKDGYFMRDNCFSDYKDLEEEEIQSSTVPTFSIGTVTTVGADEEATVTISGDERHVILNFEIPRGVPGTIENPED